MFLALGYTLDVGVDSFSFDTMKCNQRKNIYSAFQKFSFNLHGCLNELNPLPVLFKRREYN